MSRSANWSSVVAAPTTSRKSSAARRSALRSRSIPPPPLPSGRIYDFRPLAGRGQPEFTWGMVRDARPRQFLGRKTLLGLILLLILLLIAGWLLYLKIGGGGTANSGGNGVKYDYHITGQIPRSAASCAELAPAEVPTLEFPDARRTWLRGGALYADATFTPYDQYKGELKTDGSFRLLSRGAAINGRFA